MVTGLRIPPDHIPTLKRLATISPSDLERLEHALGQLPLGVLSLKELDTKAREIVPTEPGGLGGSEIVQVLLSLASQTRYHAWTLDELITGVSESSDLELDKDERSFLVQSLERLLRIPPLVALSKGVDVLSEFQNLYHSARVVTDIRPVFSDDPTLPLGVVFVHSLKVDYLSNGQMQSIYFGLEDNDLRELKKVIERAEKKSSGLAKVIDETSLTRFTVEDVEG